MSKRPCSECPWRRDSVQGYLGGNDAETYVEIHRTQGIILCHTDPVQQCRGSLIALRNSATLPREPLLAVAVQSVEADRETVFAHWSQFVQYHGGS